MTPLSLMDTLLPCCDIVVYSKFLAVATAVDSGADGVNVFGFPMNFLEYEEDSDTLMSVLSDYAELYWDSISAELKKVDIHVEYYPVDVDFSVLADKIARCRGQEEEEQILNSFFEGAKKEEGVSGLLLAMSESVCRAVLDAFSELFVEVCAYRLYFGEKLEKVWDNPEVLEVLERIQHLLIYEDVPEAVDVNVSADGLYFVDCEVPGYYQSFSAASLCLDYSAIKAEVLKLQKILEPDS